ncbi:MAG: lysine--tRNA ligase [Actinobacteria bacterium]|nr:lysine--tRNA ligase [Actinomycetota bacterium]
MFDEHNEITDPILVRLRNLDKLREKGIEPYKKKFVRTHLISEVRKDYENIEPGTETGVRVSCAGRILALRTHGKATFADLKDGSQKIQLFASLNQLGEEEYELFTNLDIGDIIGVEGTVFKTRKGELSIKLEKFEILSKSLRPLPEKWHGLKDVEIRFRQRYVDLIMNEDVKQVFYTRSRIISLIRKFLDEKGFIEVDTPMLHPIPGGATARPFITHHNALDMDLYLRIAPELYLKRLVVGGFEKVYELNRNFRNEGISVKHNPEFTMLELYQAYADYLDMMDLIEELVTYVVQEVKGTLEFEYQGIRLNFNRPWRRLTMVEAIKEIACENVSFETDIETLRQVAKKYGADVKPYYGKGKLITEIFEKAVESKIAGPMIIYDYPVEVSPLARKKEDNPDVVERFEVIVAGREIVNAFSELNDPIDQAKRFYEQVKLAEAGEEETQRFDYDYVRALEYGLPPTGGAGLGIDRLVMLLTDRYSIREVLLFPHLRPEEPEEDPVIERAKNDDEIR